MKSPSKVRTQKNNSIKLNILHNIQVGVKNLPPRLLALFPVVFSTIFLVISLAGCTTNYAPQISERVKIVDNYAVIQNEEVLFAVAPQLWTKDPQEVSNYYTTLYLTVKNQTKETITVHPNEIKILDEERNQYDVQSVEKVSEIFLWNDPFFDRFAPFNDKFEKSLNDRTLARANIYQDAFSFGDIMPGAKKSGYLFFNKLPTKNKQLTVIFDGEEIVFTRN